MDVLAVCVLSGEAHLLICLIKSKMLSRRLSLSAYPARFVGAVDPLLFYLLMGIAARIAFCFDEKSLSYFILFSFENISTLSCRIRLAASNARVCSVHYCCLAGFALSAIRLLQNNRTQVCRAPNKPYTRQAAKPLDRKAVPMSRIFCIVHRPPAGMMRLLFPVLL